VVAAETMVVGLVPDEDGLDLLRVEEAVVQLLSDL
jgi:hypothetical protein